MIISRLVSFSAASFVLLFSLGFLISAGPPLQKQYHLASLDHYDSARAAVLLSNSSSDSTSLVPNNETESIASPLRRVQLSISNNSGDALMGSKMTPLTGSAIAVETSSGNHTFTVFTENAKNRSTINGVEKQDGLTTKAPLVQPSVKKAAVLKASNPKKVLFKHLADQMTEASPPDKIIHRDTNSTSISVNSYSNICFYGSTNLFFEPHTTKNFVMNLLTFLRDISLRAYNEALLGGESTKLIDVIVPITSYEPHFASLKELLAFLQPTVDTYKRIRVHFSPDAYSIVKRNFRKQHGTCEWVVVTKLDADDIIFPGYLDWIAQKVIPTLNGGAVVGGRHMPRLSILGDSCFLDTNTGPLHWAGESMGQTCVYRRAVFEALHMPFDAAAHTRALSLFRRGVFTHILKKKPPNIPLSMDKSILFDRSLQESWDKEMENATGVRMVEPSLEGNYPFGPPSIYLRSPLSSHFEYQKINRFTSCDTNTKWNQIIKDAMHLNGIRPLNHLDYVRKTIQTMNFSVYDTCKSHTMFSQFQVGAKRAWFGNATTCEEMDTRVRQAIINSAV